MSGGLQSTWTLREAGGARPGAAQRLVAVPWRHPALILACALAGALATAALPQHRDASPLAVANGHVQPILPAPDAIASAPMQAGAGGPGLRLDLELGPDLAAAPGEVVPHDDAALVAEAAASMPQPDDVRELGDIDALLQQAPTAAGRAAVPLLEDAPASTGLRGGLVAAGLLAGLLTGLLAAAARELRGDRMRSVREAEWALGAPVLGAIPTLSARSRGMLLAPASRRGGAEPA